LPDYDQPPIPAPGYLWTPGYWAWNNLDYYWVPGTWVEAPQPGLLWTPGYWGFVGGVYAFHLGYWGPHVGFYGGVAYGFGYGGVGYEGGHWENGAFFYNRTANNFGDVHIDKVFEKPVTIANASGGRASFNGPGGIDAKPTAEEEAAANETHVPPTDRQLAHARAASMKGGLFMSTNHGKPTIAATSKAGAFTGAGVIKAKAAGAPFGQPGGPTPSAAEKKEEKKEEMKAPAKGELKPEPKGTPAVEPKAEKVEKKTLEGAKPKPTAAPAGIEGHPLSEPGKKPSPKPMAEKPVKHPEADKKHCGGPDEPKC
jgi:hypothetical protein